MTLDRKLVKRRNDENLGEGLGSKLPVSCTFCWKAVGIMEWRGMMM